MVRHGVIGVWILALVVAASSAMLAVPRNANAQAVLPRSGQSFSFGIIEGPYSLTDSASLLQTTNLILTVVSAYSGCGIITSPSGYTQDFSFAPGAPTVITLPLNLIHINDLGKTNKGLLVHTTQPVNLVLHDYVPYAGDATQILPDNALDTSYVSCGWGIWDDPSDGENDLTEFIVTAVSDSTFVTITPSVRTLLNQADSVPFTVMLNRGQCYIVKADTSDHPVGGLPDPSLSGSTVVSTKPVSVISGLTCAYVPVGVQACNELMDELIGRKWWGSHFFVQPLDLNDTDGEIVLTSSTDFTAKINANTLNSTNGRLALTFTRAIEIHTIDGLGHPFPVEAHQLTRSYSDCNSGIGDPSLVSVLDTTYYTDTVLWNTPSFFFSHSVPIICPTADLSRATLDGVLLSQLGVPSSVINGSSYSAINPPVKTGFHRIVSPDPIFAISAGFYDADAYTFIPGTAGAKQPQDSAGHVVVLQADTARACSDFNVTASVSPPILSSEGAIEFTVSLSYDPSTLHLIGIIPLAVLMNASYKVDTSTPGTVTITVLGNPLLTGDSLFRFLFEGWKVTAATTVGLQSSISICGDDSEMVSVQPVTFPVLPSTDTIPRKFLLTNSNAVLCDPLNIALSTDSIVLLQDGLVLSKIEILFNPLTEQFQGMTLGNLLANKPTILIQKYGDYSLLLTPPAQVSGGSSVLQFEFIPQVPSASDTVRARVYYLQCGDTLVQDLTLVFSIGNNNAFVAPRSLAFDSTLPCLPLGDTILLGDSSCLPLTLTSVSVSGTDWTLLNANGQPLTLPSIVQSHSGLPILVQFHPQAVVGDRDSITLTYSYSDSTYTRTIAISGAGKAPGPLQFPQSLNFGGASLCSPDTDQITFSNPTCDTIKVDSVRVSLPFVLVSKLPLMVKPGRNSGAIKVQYAPHALMSDTGIAIVTLTVNDTVVTDTVTISGTGESSGKVTYSPDTLKFGSATPCTAFNSDITFINKSCDTATIDSVFITPPFVLLSQPPLKINPENPAPGVKSLQVQYAPDTISNDTGRAIVELTVNGNLVFDTILFTGASKATGLVEYPPSTLDFGTASLCSQVDSQIVFSNLTPCYPVIIDSVRLAPPFAVLGKLPDTININSSGGLEVRYSPDSNASDTGRAIVTLTVNGSLVTDTVTFIGRGAGGGGANLLTTAQNDSIVFTRNECDPPDTVPFYLFNPGCDSLTLTSGFKIISDSAGAWTAIANPTSGLAARDSVLIALVTHDTVPGTYTGFFQTSYLDSNGVERPFSLWIAETITRTPRTMALDTAPIDLGTVYPCQTSDTAIIPYTNTSCVPVNVIGWTLANLGSSFILSGTGQDSTLYPLQPSSTDSLHVTFDGSKTTGVIHDTVIVSVGTDKDSVRRIPLSLRIISGGNTDAVSVYIKDSTITIAPGDTIEIPVYLSGNDTLGPTSIMLPFGLDTNALSIIGFQPAIAGITAGALSYSNGVGASPATLIVPLQATSLTIDTEMLMGTLHCIVYLSDTLATSVTLNTVSVTSVNAPCIAFSQSVVSVNIILKGCGDQTTLQMMKTGHISLGIQSITPNPAMDAVQINFINPTSAAISYEVVDVLGTVRAEGVASGAALALDVHSFGNGLYYLRARDAATGVTASGRFVVER